MDTARTLEELRGCGARARVGSEGPQGIHRPRDGSRRDGVAPGSLLRTALCAALLSGAASMAVAQPAHPTSSVPATAPALQSANDLRALVPTSVFVQAGAAAHVTTFSVGGVWTLPWQRDETFGRLSATIEAAIGQWQTNGQRQHSHSFAQVGFTPSLRFFPDAWRGHWFVEAGVGTNVIAPAYRTDGKRFSTKFNFGDHLAIGRQFGVGNAHEIALRIEHFSNAGIDHPNPGENFVQLRWVVRH